MVADPDDPFRVAWLERDTQDRLPEEAAALALTGGRRVVRVRDVADGALAPLRRALEAKGDALIVLEAPGLPARSKLRTWLDKEAAAVSIGCYPDDGTALGATIRAGLQQAGVVADPDALLFLTRQLGADRAQTASEVAKLALYAGDGGRVDLEAAQACVGDAAALSAEDALYAATTGDAAAADRALGLALGEGATPVAVLRVAQGHLQRLHRARLMMQAGQGAEVAAKALRPPVFFRRLPAFTQALRRWSPPALLAALRAMSEAEQACKRTGAPDELICRAAIARLARR